VHGGSSENHDIPTAHASGENISGNSLPADSNSAANEETPSKILTDNNGIEAEKEHGCDLAKFKSNKLKPWRSCEIM
jgi:hypothetical protein